LLFFFLIISEGKVFDYTVLVLMIDNYITDLQRTINSIVRHSDKPLSIIIVGWGVGEEEVCI
jgi:hypothetical protein